MLRTWVRTAGIAAALALALSACGGEDPAPGTGTGAPGPCPAELAGLLAEDRGWGEIPPDEVAASLGLPDRRAPHCAFGGDETVWAFYPREGGAMVDELESLVAAEGFMVASDGDPEAFTGRRGDETVAVAEQAADDASRPYHRVFSGSDDVILEIDGWPLASDAA